MSFGSFFLTPSCPGVKDEIPGRFRVEHEGGDVVVPNEAVPEAVTGFCRTVEPGDDGRKTVDEGVQEETGGGQGEPPGQPRVRSLSPRSEVGSGVPRRYGLKGYEWTWEVTPNHPSVPGYGAPLSSRSLSPVPTRSSGTRDGVTLDSCPV